MLYYAEVISYNMRGIMVSQVKRVKLQEKIASLQAQLADLDQKPVSLTRSSDGVPELIEQLNKVIKLHKVETVDVIEVLLKAKRTGRTLAPKE